MAVEELTLIQDENVYHVKSREDLVFDIVVEFHESYRDIRKVHFYGNLANNYGYSISARRQWVISRIMNLAMTKLFISQQYGPGDTIMIFTNENKIRRITCRKESLYGNHFIKRTNCH